MESFVASVVSGPEEFFANMLLEDVSSMCIFGIYLRRSIRVLTWFIFLVKKRNAIFKNQWTRSAQSFIEMRSDFTPTNMFKCTEI